MPWGQLILTLQSRADEYKDVEEEPKEATFQQIAAAFGA